MTKTLPMSRFIQNYNQHLTEAERTDDVLVLQQRAGRTAWVLETEDRVRDTAVATEYIATVLSTIAHDEALVARFADALVQAQPWTAFLPEQDRQAFAAEASDTLRACAAIGKYTAFADLVHDWRSTAEIWSDPALAESLSGDIGETLNQPV